MSINETMKFKLEAEKENEIRKTIMQVYDSLNEKGYNPIDQLVGYVMSSDPTYITNHKNARSLITKIDTYEILKELIREYVKD